MADLKKFINPQFDGGTPDIPLVVGDRMYSQDYLRDFQYLKGQRGSGMEWISNSVPILLTGGVVSQGAGTTLNITAARGYHKKAVEVEQDFSSLPPTKTTLDVIAPVECTSQTNLAIASAVADGATVNYVKLRHAYSDLNQRTRAKKPGTYYFEVEDSYEIVVDDSVNTDYEILLDTFTLTAGGVFTFSGTQDNKKLKFEEAVIDNLSGTTIVYDQTTFNAIWERTGANAYKIKDAITSLVVMPLAGGYDCYSGSSFLSGGDAYGILSTNNCLDIEFKSGAYWYVEDTISYVLVDSSNTKVYGLDLRGLGSTAVAITNSIKIDASADNVSLISCKVQSRSSNVACKHFLDSNGTAVAIKCLLYDVDCTTILYCFESLRTIDCSIDTVSGDSTVYGFYQCYQMSNCRVESLSASTLYAFPFIECNVLTNCHAKTIQSATITGANANGFATCDTMSSCTADTIQATGATGYAYGFRGCTNVDASCNATNITSVTAGRDIDFHTCSNEPFKDLHKDEKTMVNYAAAGNMFFYTALKDGFIWGFVATYSSGGEEVWIKEGGYATGRADTDVSIWLNSSSSISGAYCIPVKSGRSYYFKKATAIGVSVTLRFMPFGTTT